MPDANYSVAVTPNGAANYAKFQYSVDGRTANGFTITGYEIVPGSTSTAAINIWVRWIASTYKS